MRDNIETLPNLEVGELVELPRDRGRPRVRVSFPSLALALLARLAGRRTRCCGRRTSWWWTSWWWTCLSGCWTSSSSCCCWTSRSPRCCWTSRSASCCRTRCSACCRRSSGFWRRTSWRRWRGPGWWRGGTGGSTGWWWWRWTGGSWNLGSEWLGHPLPSISLNPLDNTK